MTPGIKRKLENLALEVGLENDGHGNRVAAMVPSILTAAGLEGYDPAPIVLGARLHDIGKRLVPPSILMAPRSLMRYEQKIIANHPEDGLTLVKRAVGHVPEEVCSCIVDHHEHWDGSGYPNNLCGQAIPMAARVVSIADVIDALASPRPYKAGLSPAVIRNVLLRGKGRLFDPALVDGVLDQYDNVLAARANAQPPQLVPVEVPGAPQPNPLSHLV